MQTNTSTKLLAASALLALASFNTLQSPVNADAPQRNSDSLTIHAWGLCQTPDNYLSDFGFYARDGYAHIPLAHIPSHCWITDMQVENNANLTEIYTLPVLDTQTLSKPSESPYFDSQTVSTGCYEDEIAIWIEDSHKCIAYDDLSPATQSSWYNAEQSVYADVASNPNITVRNPE